MEYAGPSKKSTDWVEHEAIDALAGGEHYHGGAAVEGVACCHKGPARVQSILLTGLIICGLKETVTAEYVILVANATQVKHFWEIYIF